MHFCIQKFFPFQDPNPSKRGSWTKHDWFYFNSSAVEIKLNNPSDSICLSKTRELIEPAVTSSTLSFISSNLSIYFPRDSWNEWALIVTSDLLLLVKVCSSSLHPSDGHHLVVVLQGLIPTIPGI